MLQAKAVAQSRTEQTQIVMPRHINGSDRIFGGQLMEWIDILAGVVARRHSGHDVTTAAVDNLQFKAPAHVGDTMALVGQITHIGHTSMEVRVDTFVEGLDGEKHLVNTAYLVLVALDDQGQPTPVPPLLLDTEEERREWEAGIRRYNLRKQRRIEAY